MSIQCPTCTYVNDFKFVKNNEFCKLCRTRIELSETGLENIKQANKQELLLYENYKKAIDEIPEFFTGSKQIIIKGKINNIEIEFLLDTGAAISILPVSLIDKCKLKHIFDRRMAGKLLGVGTDRIMGKIHYIEININGFNIPCSFVVCENKRLGGILGIDFMLSNNCIIDMKNKKLKIGNMELNMIIKDI